MNLHFLKLRVAADPWILVDRCGAEADDTLTRPDSLTARDSATIRDSKTTRDSASSPATQAISNTSADMPAWPTAAALACHPYRGAAARGMVVVDGEAEPYRVRAWNASGQIQNLPPVAALCAARWLFDTGRATGETVTIAAPGGPIEILVLDSRNFGVALGNPQARPAEHCSPDRFSVAIPELTLQVRLHDGSIPRPTTLPGDARNVLQVGCVARHELRLKARSVDALQAAGAAAAAASLAAYADRECTVLIGDSRIMVQWPEGGPMFLAAAPAYCLAGDIWLDVETGAAGRLS